MSRNVDWNDPTDDDLAWAVEWERWHEIQQAGFDVDEVQQRYGVQRPDDANDPFRTAGVPRVGSDAEMRVNPETGRVETIGNGSDGSETDDSDEEPDYEAWKVDELRRELQNRQLPADGNKSDLVVRLMEDDEAAAEDDENE